MRKVLLVGAALALTLACTHEAQAGGLMCRWFGICRSQSYQQPAYTQPAQPAPQYRQAQGNSRQYRSFSYDPGSAGMAAQPAYRPNQQEPPSHSAMFRADRKVRGFGM